MPAPTITTVIPTYKRPALLRRAIQSVLGQTYPHLKVLVCDNASGDDTAAVVDACRHQDARVEYLCQPHNVGMFENFNVGMRAVDTEYFSLLCDDDLLLPRFYEHAIGSLRQSPQAEFYCGQAALYNEALQTHSVRPRRLWTDGVHEAARWVPRMLEMFFTISGCVFSTAMRPKVLPYEQSIMTDVVFLLRAAASFPFVVSLTPGAIIVDTGENATRHTSPEELDRSYRVLRECCERLPGLTEAEREAARAALRKHFRVVINAMLRDAMVAGDRRRFDRLAALALDRDWLDARRRLRLKAARPSGATPWLFPMVRLSTRLAAGHKRWRRSRGGSSTLADVLALYSGAPNRDRPGGLP